MPKKSILFSGVYSRIMGMARDTMRISKFPGPSKFPTRGALEFGVRVRV